MPHGGRDAADWCAGVLGYRFRDAGLLRQALTHRSAGGDHNERLEYLGDAVLGLVVAGLLYAARPAASEGELTRLRARLVRRETLAAVARRLDVGEYVLLGSGELRTGGHQRDSILANALEALVGAVYLDAGLDPAGTIIHRLFGTELAALPDAGDLRDPKTRLQEHLQARGLPLPDYRVNGVRGAAHDQWFAVTCRLPADGHEYTGEGASRRAAEQAAAARALAAIAAAAGDTDD
jgi:ribonuclease-3